MATNYAIPPSPLSRPYQPHVKHPSQAHPPPPTYSAWGPAMSSEKLPQSFEDSTFEANHAKRHSHSHAGGHDHSHSHDHGHQHDHSHGHAPSPSFAHARSGSHASSVGARPSSMVLDGWMLEKTMSGKSVMAPAAETDSALYSPKVAAVHDASAKSGERSFFTNALLPYTSKYPLLHAIMTEKDSRRIFYFMTLNFAFMMVQAFYGYVTDSLGLLSDSIHMFFDCVALLVGLVAAVMSKWPPSQRFPYGFGKIETLSGFANGILLMLLSVEIAFEAFERLWEGTQTKRLGELLLVSSMGLAVNLVGMMAFGHHHHHGHGHSHGHSHSHAPSHDHGHSHGHDHSHDHAQVAKAHDCKSHDNENMHGIYLHVLADTLGSVSVIVSTILTSIWGWSGWDPLASCFIAILIFLSSQPLVVSSAKRLLLAVPEDTEYTLRNLLSGISDQRGVVSYAAPKFWRDDRFGGDDGDTLVGVVHVVAARGFPLDDVRDRVRDYLANEGIDVVVQVEREGDNACWCCRERGLVPPTPKAF